MIPGTAPTEVAARAEVLRRLELDVSRRLSGLLAGDHLSDAAGPGSEAAGARAYGPGDDARRIDWSLSARMTAPHVRTTDADRELRTCIVVDRSASMDFGTTVAEKRDLALAAVAAFGFLTLRAGNQLAVVVAGGAELASLPVRRGSTGLMATLAAVHATERPAGAPSVDAGLGAALTRAERTSLRRGQVVVVSDFLDDPIGWQVPLRRISLRHSVLAVHVRDPREDELPDVGLLAVVDPETGRHLHVQTRSAALRRRYAEAAARRRADVLAALRSAGVEHLELSTERDWVADVADHVARRRRAARPAATGAAR